MTALALADAIQLHAEYRREPTKDRAYQLTRLGAAVADYLVWKQASARPKTLDQYERDLARLCWRYPDEEPGELDSSQILACLIGDFPEASRGRASAAFRDFYKWAIPWLRLRANPMDLIPSFRRPPARVYDIFTESERRRIIKAARFSPFPTRDTALVHLLFDTGARKGDIRSLRWLDVDFTDRVVVYRDRKGGDDHIVTFGEDCQRALMDYRYAPLPVLDREPEPTDYLLCPNGLSPQGVVHWVKPAQPMSATGAHVWWKRRLEAADVRHRKLHMTRHTHGTEVYEATGDLEEVRHRLGHVSISTTQLYVKQARKRHNAALIALEAYRAAQDVPVED